MSLNYYRVPCVTDAKYEHTWSEEAPTVCPVNPAHTIAAADIAVVDKRPVLEVISDPYLEAVEPGATTVVANGRPAIEVAANQTGWGAIMARWPQEINAAARLKVTVKAILKSLGTGTVLRLAVRAKASGAGDDSSSAWADAQYLDKTVSHAMLGEVFEGTLNLDASGFGLDDALALQVGRDGEHANDTLDQPAQIIGVKAEAY